MSGSLSGARVLVTGASGFLGARLAERLSAQCGADVRVLVRRVLGAVRAARYPIQIIPGDMSDAAAIERAAAGCDVIFNCAKGKGSDPALRRAVDVDAITSLVRAASRSRGRLVHVSTMAVYDQPQQGEFDESTPCSPKGDYYADAKLEGERLALALGARESVPVTVVQPTIVYGPYADIHGSHMLEELRTRRMILVNGGTGVCNAVYVDDVVSAMLLSATNDRAAGERFIVTGPEYPTWAEFIGRLEDMLGVTRAISMSEAEAIELWRRSSRRPWVLAEMLRLVGDDRALRGRLLATREGAIARAVVRRWFPKKAAGARTTRRELPDSEIPVQPIRPAHARNLARRAHASSDKARRLLGYSPQFDLPAGMKLTRAWADWARLLG